MYPTTGSEDTGHDPTAPDRTQACLDVGSHASIRGGSRPSDVLAHLLHLGPEVRSALLALANDHELQQRVRQAVEMADPEAEVA